MYPLFQLESEHNEIRKMLKKEEARFISMVTTHTNFVMLLF